MVKVGSIPYIERGDRDNVVEKRFGGLHKPAILRHGKKGYRLAVRGIPEKQLPPADPSYERALKRAKRWVTRRRGTCLKRPLPWPSL